MGTYYGYRPVKLSNIGNTKKRYVALDKVVHYMWKKHKVWLLVYGYSSHEIMANHIGW